MELLFAILNQPFVLTLLSLFVGGYLLSVIAERRSKKEKIRDKSIEFISDAGSYLYNFIPHIYEQLRQGQTKLTSSSNDALRALYSTRMLVQVGSQAYLQSEQFYKRYFRLLDELREVFTTMTAIEKGNSSKEIVKKIRERKRLLMEYWPVPEETSSQSENIIENLISWMDMINGRTAKLLSTTLKDVIA